jgi:hypothetical protein
MNNNIIKEKSAGRFENFQISLKFNADFPFASSGICLASHLIFQAFVQALSVYPSNHHMVVAKSIDKLLILRQGLTQKAQNRQTLAPHASAGVTRNKSKIRVFRFFSRGSR